jgi:hypothetical protein
MTRCVRQFPSTRRDSRAPTCRVSTLLTRVSAKCMSTQRERWIWSCVDGLRAVATCCRLRQFASRDAPTFAGLTSFLYSSGLRPLRINTCDVIAKTQPNLQFSLSQPPHRHAPRLHKPAIADPRFRRNRWHILPAGCGSARHRACTKRRTRRATKALSVNTCRSSQNDAHCEPVQRGLRLFRGRVQRVDA